ncbi:MAG: Gmad2 immunoglobulin-like domain-containing protein [Minisyncoccia bacterium]|jgi:hypothetical protein
MEKGWIIVICLFIVIVLGILALIFIPGPKVAEAPTQNFGNTSTTTPTAAASFDDLIVVTSPLPNSTLSSTTITIIGKARGTWYFEAVFPITLKDAAGTVIAQGQGQAESDWTTADFVPFTATLTFPAQPTGSTGTLVLKNDNPSGDPAKQKELDIPIRF